MNKLSRFFLSSSKLRRQHALFARKLSGKSSKKLKTELDFVLNTEKHLTLVEKSLQESKDLITNQLINKGFAIVDNFFGAQLCHLYRSEAENLWKKNLMVASKSTRWDHLTNSVITYDKYNVQSTQLLGGEMYFDAPRLHEYVFAMVPAIVPIISEVFPEAQLSNNLASNKLAVCLGNGSSYDKHFDNSCSDDARKLTVLYYLNPSWIPEHGGYFRAYHTKDEYEDIAPVGDRLLVFWSDRLEHSVLESFAPHGESDYRYAFTIWIATTDTSTIQI